MDTDDGVTHRPSKLLTSFYSKTGVTNTTDVTMTIAAENHNG